MRNIKKAVFVSAASLGVIVAGATAAAAQGADAEAAAVGSPGVVSGNVVQVPIDIPINLCGNSVNIVGILNPAFGNTCINASGDFRRHFGRGHESGGEFSGHGEQAGGGGFHSRGNDNGRDNRDNDDDN
ncbi:chaplin [Peterkaempfera griseoplana]|uniref:chaplin n=1 Tax=Peterkaempfera griseoplana TaxID=66896 RepID=UPI0007C67C3C|nr:chaplin [Peterkaempfera griseoplana]